jgi:hypothetical protein
MPYMNERKQFGTAIADFQVPVGACARPRAALPAHIRTSLTDTTLGAPQGMMFQYARVRLLRP